MVRWAGFHCAEAGCSADPPEHLLVDVPLSALPTEVEPSIQVMARVKGLS